MTTTTQFPVQKTADEWRETLSPEQYKVLRANATERAFTSPLNNEKRPGTFVCAGCGQLLFSSDSKYDSGTGWPSFYKPLEGAVGTSIDRSLFFAGSRRSALRALRRTSGPRVPRWSASDRAALLHERSGDEV